MCYNQGYLRSGVLTIRGSYDQRFLQSRVLTIRGSYDQGPYNQGFLQLGVQINVSYMTSFVKFYDEGSVLIVNFYI